MTRREFRASGVRASGVRASGVRARGQWGQPFTYDLFDSLKLSELASWALVRRIFSVTELLLGMWNTPQFRRDSIQRDPSTPPNLTPQ